MSKNLVVVESPAKAKTIKKYLGNDFEVLASYGHVRDLVPKEGAVDPLNHFAMRYQLIEKNEKHVQAIARAMKKATTLYLATDPDREGEAISWHLLELLREQGILKDKGVFRVVFYEITRNAIRAAVANPRQVSTDLVNAQQARRALDYLVGFNLSPLLWKKAGLSGASAGRVQSPALRLICEREEEIAKFIAREYWTIGAENELKEQKIPARLIELENAKIEQFSITSETQAISARIKLEQAANGVLTVNAVDRKQRKRNPAPPFTTSTLQQEAARKLGFGTQRTMRIAQQLYEGIDFGEGAVGLITYMRTDSVNLSVDAVQEMRQVIQQMYGADAVPEAPRIYKTKSKNAQEAHEAVRPTSAALAPDRLEGKLEADQQKLYTLIWRRALASQMAPAVYDTVAIDMVPGAEAEPKSRVGMFRATGSTLVTPGYIAVYQEGMDDVSEDEGDRILPPMNVGDQLKLLEIKPEQHFTEPPPRFSEASLVKALEEFGIGRPSTYAAIIQTLLGKKYAELVNRRFIPSDLGKIINKFLTRNFETYVNYGFTAKMENDLDEIADGREQWVPVLERFWDQFKQRVDFVDGSVTRDDVSESRELGKDPVSGKPISVRYGKYGPFVQLGSKEDADKPKFASLRPHQRMDTLTLEDAFELFKLPKTLGKTTTGEDVKVAIGRFGPYVQYAAKKYVSIKDDDPYTIELPRALELIKAKEEFDANRTILDFPQDGIQVLNGRYGPYITDRIKNAKIPKDRDPKTLTLIECRELIAAAPMRFKKGGRFGKAAAMTTQKNAAKTATAEAPSPAKPSSAAAKKAPAKKAAARKAAAKKTAPAKQAARATTTPRKS